jgi:hypothetical protein
MPNADGQVSARPSATLSGPMLGAGTALMLGWCLSIADPCLLGLLRGDPSANPIAITECRPGITNGDAIVRLAVLLLVAGLFACVFQLIQPERKKLNVAAHGVLALTIALANHFALSMLSPWKLTNPLRVWLAVWITTGVAAFLAALAGSALASSAKTS